MGHERDRNTTKIKRFDIREHYFANRQRLSENDENQGTELPTGAGDDGVLLALRVDGGLARLGEYYVRTIIYEQTMRLQVDTGSASLIVTGEACRNCTARKYLAWNRDDAVPCDGKTCFQCYPGSSTCGFHLKYGDDTPIYDLEAAGVIVQTPVSFKQGPTNADKVYIYVIQREIGTWPKKVDGILGLGYERLNCNPTCFPLAWRTLSPKGTLGFSLCFGDETGKLMFYNKAMKRVQDGARIKLNVLGDPKMYYAVKCRGLAIQDTSDTNRFALFEYIPVQEIRTRMFAIFDSGTTLLIVPTTTWISLVEYFQEKFCDLPGVCDFQSIFDRPNENEAICITEPPHKTFPTLALVMSDVVLRIPPSLYFIRYRKDIYCLAIQPGPVLIVGDAILRGFTVDHETDAIYVTEKKDDDCGEVDGLASYHDSLIVSKNFRISSVHHTISVYGPIRRFASLTILVLIIVALLQIWRRYMRRRLYSQVGS